MSTDAADLGGVDVRRMLRPGGSLHLVEHSLSPSARTAARQRRIRPWWEPFAEGCHLDRDLPTLIAAAGFAVELDRATQVSPPPFTPWGWFVSGAGAG